MARVHLLENHLFGIDQKPVVVVDCSTGNDDEDVFDAEHAKKQGRKLKKQAEAAAVVVQFGAKFWVV